MFQPSVSGEECEGDSPHVPGRLRAGGLSLASAAENLSSVFSFRSNSVAPRMLGTKVNR